MDLYYYFSFLLKNIYLIKFFIMGFSKVKVEIYGYFQWVVYGVVYNI